MLLAFEAVNGSAPAVELAGEEGRVKEYPSAAVELSNTVSKMVSVMMSVM